MNGKYIEKLIELMDALEKEAEECLKTSDEMRHHTLLGNIKYLSGYIATLKDFI